VNDPAWSDAGNRAPPAAGNPFCATINLARQSSKGMAVQFRHVETLVAGKGAAIVVSSGLNTRRSASLSRMNFTGSLPLRLAASNEFNSSDFLRSACSG